MKQDSAIKLEEKQKMSTKKSYIRCKEFNNIDEINDVIDGWHIFEYPGLTSADQIFRIERNPITGKYIVWWRQEADE